jgi:predicted hotdog family 3-hydroxylacyl-ACP dehydratase
MLVNKQHIQLLLPHKDPFIMIDELITATPQKMETRFLIEIDNIFLDENGFREFGMIENMAQSCAAGLCFIGMQNKQKPQDGYLGSVSKLQLHQLAQLHDVIQTIVYPLQQFGNMHLLKCVTYLKGALLMEAELKLVGQ